MSADPEEIEKQVMIEMLRPGGRPVALYCELDAAAKLPPPTAVSLTTRLVLHLENRIVELEEAARERPLR